MTVNGIYKPVSFENDFVHIIDGKPAVSDKLLDVVNPATRVVIASVPIATAQQVDETVDAAQKAFVSWSKTSWAERQEVLLKVVAVLEQYKTELATLLTKEQGKPLKTQAIGEMDHSIKWCEQLATEELPDEPVYGDDTKTIYTRRVPLGVCVGIAPWNYPVGMVIWKLSPALVTGNTIIIKPSPFTPLTALKIVELIQQVVPPGVVSILSGDDNLGPWLTEHPRVARISFTGSCATGKSIMKSAAINLKRITLELGGNDAAIVLSDVDVASVVPPLFWTIFNNSGQVCLAAKRVYIHEDIYDEVLKGLVEYSKNLKVGDGMDPTSMLGPVQNKMQYEKVKNLIQDSKAQGLKFAVGGEVDEASPGYFIPLTLVDNPPDHARIVTEEQFGPIVPVMKFKTDEEVIERANNTQYGLGGSVWGKDVERAERVAQQLQTGLVWVSGAMGLLPQASFGGNKLSGLGIQGGKDGLKEWTNAQTIYKPKTVTPSMRLPPSPHADY